MLLSRLPGGAAGIDCTKVLRLTQRFINNSCDFCSLTHVLLSEQRLIFVVFFCVRNSVYWWLLFCCSHADLQNTAMPDERAVMTYVSSYYHCFSGAQKVINLLTSDCNWSKSIELKQMLAVALSAKADFSHFSWMNLLQMFGVPAMNVICEMNTLR